MPSVHDIDDRALITPPGHLVMSTQSDLTSRLTHAPSPWQSTIDKLTAWWTDPQDDDEDYPPPVRNILAAAIRFAQNLRDQKLDPPHRVVQDANGGIIFERRNGIESMKYHFWSDGIVEFIEMRGHTVTRRQRVN